MSVSDRDANSVSTPVLTLTVPDDDELRTLQATRQDTSGTLKYLQNDKVGLKGLMKLDKYVDELEIRFGLMVHVDKSNPEYVGKVIPRSAWPRVLHYFHSGPTVNHLGAAKILDRMKRCVWWPSMEADVERVCRACVLCLNKRATAPPHVRPLQPVVSEYPNHIVAVDWFGSGQLLCRSRFGPLHQVRQPPPNSEREGHGLRQDPAPVDHSERSNDQIPD